MSQDDFTPTPSPFSINEPVATPHNAPGDTVITPVITTLTPYSCTVGDPDFTLIVGGTGFSADSVIRFAGHDEPTTYDPAYGSLSTGVKPSLWHDPVVVQCQVRNGSLLSNAADFTFAGAEARGVDPDDLEDEIDEAEADGDIKKSAKRKTRR